MRLAAALSLRQVAHVVGVTQQALSQVELSRKVSQTTTAKYRKAIAEAAAARSRRWKIEAAVRAEVSRRLSGDVCES